MYARATTWLPSAQQMGLGQISFADLARAARRSRGVGQVQAPPNGIAPGTQCYDSSHDAGEVHCMSATNVLLASIPGNAPTGGATTNCSAAEMACFQTATPDILNNSSGLDICQQYVGVPCTMVMIGAVLLLIAVPLLTAGSRI